MGPSAEKYERMKSLLDACREELCTAQGKLADTEARVAELETVMRTLRDVELGKGEHTSMYLVFSIDEALGENRPTPSGPSVGTDSKEKTT